MKTFYQRGAVIHRRAIAMLCGGVMLSTLAACGGDGSSGVLASSTSASSPSAGQPDSFFTSSSGATVQSTTASAADPSSDAVKVTREEAMQFLQQATFGATEEEIARVQALGIEGWIDWQMSLPLGPTTLDYLKQAYTYHFHPANKTVRAEVKQSFWRQSLTAQDQLRWRVAYSLSQILVVSVNAGSFAGFNGPAVADYYDLLAREGFGSYRNLMEKVTYHPAMGLFLNALGNRPENRETGRVPDENYAREIMQLFTVGTTLLSSTGAPVLDESGRPIELYSPSDISGLAKVFTGFGYDCFTDYYFPYRTSCGYEKVVKPMKMFDAFHSRSPKSFLGSKIAAGTSGQQSVSQALDVLVNHPNTAPFITRQLIQRLVSSNPSPQYVKDVAGVWVASNGNLGAVVKAILLHDEARKSNQRDRIREPALHLSQLLRALSAKSVSGLYLMGELDVGEPLGMTPLAAPSVFNFYRPGYMAAASGTAASGKVAPELQIISETQVNDWIQLLQSGLTSGWGAKNKPETGRPGKDVYLDFSGPALAPAVDLARNNPAELVDWVSTRLLTSPLSSDVKQMFATAIESIPLANSKGTPLNGAAENRVRACILLIASLPEYKVEK